MITILLYVIIIEKGIFGRGEQILNLAIDESNFDSWYVVGLLVISLL